MKKLNLGYGMHPKEGYINVDIRKNTKAQVYHDLNKLPYPFKNKEFEEALMSQVLEHLDAPINVLKEVTRILKIGGVIKITVPHVFSYSNGSSLQHKTNFNEHSFMPKQLEEYEIDNLELVTKHFEPGCNWKKYIPFKKYLKLFFVGIYDNIYFELRRIK